MGRFSIVVDGGEDHDHGYLLVQKSGFKKSVTFIKDHGARSVVLENE